ncbi:odorant receptor 4-like isoform X2 [Cydia strobilella]|uniref:odorant receptor 4-like isoform X2 n=1 Tax=Cydia strobilella TaxID=1100964 RepID=UPI003004FD83
MRPLRQIDCFKVNMKFWKLLAVWPPNDMQSYYRYYQMFFTAFILLNNLLATVNFIFLPRQLDMFIDEMIFYFSEIAVTSKFLTFLFMRKKILMILSMLESDMFQPESENGLKAIDKAKKFNPAPWQYFIFLGSYMFIMILQILVPCWFGTRIQDKSQQLSQAVYDCDWTAKSRYFKSSLRLFVERANKPVSITAGKMFPLSLTTFTSIMNSSYSFFTLLRHMQSRQN